MEESEEEEDEEEEEKKKLPRKQTAKAAAAAAAAAIKRKAIAAAKLPRKPKVKHPNAALAPVDSKHEAKPGIKRKAAQPEGSSLRNRAAKKVTMTAKLTAFRENLLLPPAKIPEAGDFSKLLAGRGRGGRGRGAPRGRGAFPAY